MLKIKGSIFDPWQKWFALYPVCYTPGHSHSGKWAWLRPVYRVMNPYGEMRYKPAAWDSPALLRDVWPERKPSDPIIPKGMLDDRLKEEW